MEPRSSCRRRAAPLSLTTGLSFGLLPALLFARWLLVTPGGTARESIVPDLAVHARVSMERAAAAYDGAYRGAKMVGAPLGGLLIVWLGPTDVLFLNGATFLLSATLIRVGVPSTAGPKRDGGYLESLGEGPAFLWNDRLLRSAVGMILVTNLLDTGLGQVLLPPYGRDVAHDPRAFGLLVGTITAGAYAGMPFGGLPAGELTTVGGRTVTVYLLASVPPFAVPAWRTSEPGPEARAPGRSV
ncbi:hypothetical protein [Actinoallomurus iriomotensis]|uniref:MFS transporter n=1 Tax=Actinoallomurus iriomotensis TaxID=478107 RepID=A0A9W6SBA1_9ACTN|nr:hypothetical protein [Actinoallomurus iriomotensis]GLY91781.1 hypothetical protein Airi02_097090 [Actinoallomurus iriomotensis]